MLLADNGCMYWGEALFFGLESDLDDKEILGDDCGEGSAHVH